MESRDFLGRKGIDPLLDDGRILSMSSITSEDLSRLLASDLWETFFSSSTLAEGKASVGGKRVREVTAELLDTGDAEISGSVLEKDGTIYHPSLIFWKEGEEIRFETECGCSQGPGCSHAAALFLYLAKGKGERLERAMGGVPHAEKMNTRNLESAEKELPSEEEMEPTETRTGASSGSGAIRPTFLLRIQRRPEEDRMDWLPECFGEAFALYEGQSVPLDPSGQLRPIVTPEKKIQRSRVVETEALQCLYALDLEPGAEDPPLTLRKLEKPAFEGTLWAPNRKKWPHPEFYWQRFRHDAVPALERRGWEVRFAPGVGHKPLVFRSETWNAEIVEEGRGWFHLSAGFEIDGEEFELQPILATLVRNGFLEATEGMPAGQEFLVFLPDGRGLVLPVGRFRKLLETLGELLEFSFNEGPIRLGRLDAALLVAEEAGSEDSPAIAAPMDLIETGERLLHFEKIDSVAVPSGLRAELREYQREGYYWLQFLIESGLNGILADDMGLGKTLQSLTHVLAEVESERNTGKPSLVVAPTSVVMNWEREARKFTPDLSILVLQGAGRKSRFREIPRSDLVLTSFALLHRDIDELANHEFHLVFVDEAQHIKNPDAQVSRAAKRLRSNSRICLSGTPIENHLGELWSLMDFLMPGLLGSREQFRSTYQAPIEKDGSVARRKSLADRIGPLILRRTKHDVAKELPPKTEIVHTVLMNEGQKDLYETVRATMDKQVRQALAIRGQEAQVVFLEALLKLRQICCHPALLKENHARAESAKFEYFTDLLETLREEGHRVLVFSQFTSMLSIIEAHLMGGGVSYLKLTGETRDRQELVERFQGGEGQVFLISLKAGGTGLTLTGADTVIHYDPWWNPAAENQATDRAYRIGQDKPVFVHRLICQSTVEERIQEMQEKKDGLAVDLLAGATSRLNLTNESLSKLLGE